MKKTNLSHIKIINSYPRTNQTPNQKNNNNCNNLLYMVFFSLDKNVIFN